jgi:uncharacterized protein YlzI (FlbEa/FlbD family)
MINVTRLDGTPMLLDENLIETIEPTRGMVLPFAMGHAHGA